MGVRLRLAGCGRGGGGRVGGVERCSLEASEVAVDNKGEDSDGRRDHGVGYPLTAVLREACRIQMHTDNRQDVMSRKGPTLRADTCGLHEERVAVLEEDNREELPPGVGVG